MYLERLRENYWSPEIAYNTRQPEDEIGQGDNNGWEPKATGTLLGLGSLKERCLRAVGR